MTERYSNDGQPVTLVSGANGFVGDALCRHLFQRGHTVRAVSRRARDAAIGIDSFAVTSLADVHDGSPILDNVETIVHLAGRAHAPGMSATEQENVFRSDAQMTTRFAEAAARAGVQRFVFVSTAKVFGEKTATDECFSNGSVPRPLDAYARFKLMAEDAVRDIAEHHGMEWVVVRPVLVYGENVKGNLATLLRWLDRGYVLPFDKVENQRSLLALSDLVALLQVCLSSPSVVGQRLLAAADDSISTPGMCRALATGLGKPARLVALPESLWSALSALPFTQGKANRLAGSFLVDNSATKALTGWQPRVHTYEGLMHVGEAYKVRTREFRT